MSMLRAFAGVIVGYLIFALASMLLVGPVMAGGGVVVVIAALVALALIGAVAGLAAALIGGGKGRLTAAILACLVAAVTLINMVVGLGAEPLWYKLGTLLLTAPAILVAGQRAGR